MATRWRPKQTTGPTVAGESTRRNLLARDDNPLRRTAEAGGSDPRMAVTVDRRHQVGSCGQRSEAYSQSLLTGDKENLKKIKEAKNRQPEADQHSFLGRRKSFREVLIRDSGNNRLGADSVSVDASPKHTIHGVSSSGKSACQSETRSSEIVDPRLSAFHPFSHKSCNTSQRRTDFEKSGSAQCRNKNTTVISTNKTLAKNSSASSKHLLTQEQVENKEIKFVRKLSDSQVMHKLSTSSRVCSRNICERKTVSDGLSINEQDRTHIDSPLLNKKKVRAVPQQNVHSLFSRTCTQIPLLPKDSRIEQLFPHSSTTACSRTMTSRGQISVKNIGEFCGDFKVMASTKSVTPDVRRKTRTKRECQTLMSSKGGIQSSASGGQASDNKESSHNVQEFAKKRGINRHESRETSQHVSRGYVSDRNKNKSTQNVPELFKDQDMNCDTDSSLETSASYSDVEMAVSAESILNKNASDTNMNVLSPVGEESCLANRKLVSEPTGHSAEFIGQLQDSSDARFLQLAFQNENVKDISKEPESRNLGSKKLCQKVEIDKNEASIMFHSNLCDNNKGENRDQELMCDIGRVSSIHQAQESNSSKAENSCQGLNSNSSTAENSCQGLNSNSSKAENSCQGLNSNSSKAENSCQGLNSNSCKAENSCQGLNSNSSTAENSCQGLNSNSNKAENSCQGLNSNSSKAENSCQGLNSNSSTAENSCQGLNSNSNKAENSCQGLNSNSSKAENSCQGLNSNSSKAENSCQGLNSNSSKAENSCQGLNSNSSKAENSCQGLNSNSGTAENSCQGLNSNSGKAENSCQGLNSNSGKAENSCQGLNSNSGKAENSCQGLNSNSGKAENSCQGLNSNSNKAENSCQGLNSNSSKAENSCQGLNSNSSKAENSCQGLNSNSSTAENSCQGLNSNSSKAENSCQGLNSNSGKADNSCQGLNSNSSKADNSCQGLNSNSSKAENSCQGLNSNSSKAENSCQGLNSNRGKNLCQKSEIGIVKVDVIYPDMGIDNSKVQNVCPQLESDNNKVQNVCPQLESDNSKVQNVCPQLESDNNKVQNVCPQLEIDNNKVQNVCTQLEIDNNKVHNVCPQLESDNNKVQNVCPQLESDNNKVQNVYPQLESDNNKVQNVCPQLESDNNKVQNLCTELQNGNSKVQNIYLELEGGEIFHTVNSKSQNSISKFQKVCQELEDDNIKFQNVCQISESDRTEFQNSNSKFQDLCLELEAESNVGNLCHENDTTRQIQGLWQQLKSKKDQSNQQEIDISMWKRTGLLNKILDKAELNLEPLASLIPQLCEDYTGTMSPLDFKGLNFPRDIGVSQCSEEEHDFYDEKLEKALKDSEQLLDELRLLTGSDMDLLLSQCVGGLERVGEAVPGVHRSVAGCKKNLKMFMA